MSIEFLRALSERRAPCDITRPDEINNLVVLRAAGMVAAFTLHAPSRNGKAEVGRFLSLTPAGRQALHFRPEAGDAGHGLRR
jgi:hypothetical protein